MTQTTSQAEPTADEPPPQHAKICGRPVQVRAPISMLERFEVAMIGASKMSAPRMFAAVLGLTWPTLRRWLQKEGQAYTGDLGKYGEHAFNLIMSQENPPSLRTLAYWGQRGVAACDGGLPALPASKAEEDELVGNSSEQEG